MHKQLKCTYDYIIRKWIPEKCTFCIQHSINITQQFRTVKLQAQKEHLIYHCRGMYGIINWRSRVCFVLRNDNGDPQKINVQLSGQLVNTVSFYVLRGRVKRLHTFMYKKKIHVFHCCFSNSVVYRYNNMYKAVPSLVFYSVVYLIKIKMNINGKTCTF